MQRPVRFGQTGQVSCFSAGSDVAPYDRTYVYDAIGNLTIKAGVVYTYPASGESSVRPHAVASLSDGSSFSYDANGNPVSGLRPARDERHDHPRRGRGDLPAGVRRGESRRCGTNGRLVAVTDTASSEVTTFTYPSADSHLSWRPVPGGSPLCSDDGDGNRVKTADAGGVTYHVGRYYDQMVPQAKSGRSTAR